MFEQSGETPGIEKQGMRVGVPKKTRKKEAGNRKPTHVFN
jgi:hypothetical protein